jgi:diaminopimelate decarboxylase
VSDFSFRDDSLWCEDVPLANLAARFGTPLYVYSAHTIITNCRSLEDAFEGCPHLTTYAVKANSNVHLLRLIAAEGLGADVGSRGELLLALKAGFPPSKISFSGVGKRDDEIAYALLSDILAFNVESEQEIEVINAIAQRLQRRARMLLRLNLDIDAGTHAYISTSKKQNKFGVAAHRAVEVLRAAMRHPHIEVRGIHSHIGSQITDAETFVSAAQTLSNLVAALRAAGIPVHDLDFGGGFGVQYHGVLAHEKLPREQANETPPPASHFIKRVLPILKPTGCNISIQPGRAIIANAGVLLTQVLYRKIENGKTFIIVDAGMNDLIRPSLYRAHHQIVPLRLNDLPFETVDVVGPCCESGDFFALNRTLSHVERGDFLALVCAGAYGFVLSSNYNARVRGAEILVDGSSFELIRERERIENL